MVSWLHTRVQTTKTSIPEMKTLGGTFKIASYLLNAHIFSLIRRTFMWGGKRPGIHCLHMRQVFVKFAVKFSRYSYKRGQITEKRGGVRVWGSLTHHADKPGVQPF